MASEPLLGSAWLLSQSPSATPTASTSSESPSSSPSSSTHTRITPAVCDNYSLFKRLLDQSRRASDDAITTRLNRAAALAGTVVSGRGSAREMGPTECDAVWRDIVARWDERSKALEYCDKALRHTQETGRIATTTTAAAAATATRPDRSREDEIAPVRGLSADWKEQGRGVMDEAELKRSRLQTELAVEQIIRARTLALFASRCPSHPQSDPPMPALPVLGGNENEDEERRRRRGRDERGRVRWN
ncbi:hypothetical protein JCM8115_005625 [Rhodotorula mucilaginosa]